MVKHPSRKIQDAQAVGKPRMLGPRVSHVADPELADPAQALEFRRVDEIEQVPLVRPNRDQPMHRVAHDLSTFLKPVLGVIGHEFAVLEAL